MTGKITYCGHEFSEFVPQRTCAYISQHDLHYGEMTVRETLNFSGRCLGVGTRYEMLVELSKREKEAAIKPDPEIDAFMKATAMAGQETSLITDYVLKVYYSLFCTCIFIHSFNKQSDKPSIFWFSIRYLGWIFVLILWWEMRWEGAFLVDKRSVLPPVCVVMNSYVREFLWWNV